jgi:hypothetical protein
MTSIEATLLVSLGGFIGAIIFGLLGMLFDHAGEREATNSMLSLAMLGIGTCGISLIKAGLMALGV